MISSLSVAVLLAAATVTQDRPVEKFHEVQLAAGIRATIQKGKGPSLKLEGEKATLDNIETFVKGGRLTIRPKSGSSMNDGDVYATVTTAELDTIHASGGCTVKGDFLSGSKCSLNLSGGVQLDVTGLSCDALDIDASGGAGIKLKGTAAKLDLEASGGVQLETRALAVKDAKVDASGGVSGGIAVSDSLEASLSGGVSIKVKGHPKVARANTSGSARLSYED